VAVNQNLTVMEWPGERPTGIKDFLFARRLMKAHKPDIIVSNFGANNIMLFVSWLLKVPVRMAYYHTMVEQYISDHGRLGLRQRLTIARKGWAFRKATHILASSRRSAKDVQKYYGVTDQALHIFPNALPNAPMLNSGSARNIGFLGRLHRSKGVDVLIKAFIDIADRVPDTKLVIAGTGNEEGNLKKQLADAGLADRAIWLGQIGYTEIFNFLVGLNHLVVPSRTDNLPTVVLEGFSTATPVIGAESGGIPDMIQNGHNGFLFQSENAEELAAKMLVLLEDGKEWTRISTNAKQVFDERYSMDSLYERFEKLIV
jgi:glycosyltransferase involved in cell wall biosynthesis